MVLYHRSALVRKNICAWLDSIQSGINLQYIPTWYTMLWGNRVFTFILSLLEVDNNLGGHHLRLISTDQINNPYPRQDDTTPE